MLLQYCSRSIVQFPAILPNIQSCIVIIKYLIDEWGMHCVKLAQYAHSSLLWLDDCSIDGVSMIVASHMEGFSLSLHT